MSVVIVAAVVGIFCWYWSCCRCCCSHLRRPRSKMKTCKTFFCKFRNKRLNYLKCRWLMTGHWNWRDLLKFFCLIAIYCRRWHLSLHWTRSVFILPTSVNRNKFLAIFWRKGQKFGGQSMIVFCRWSSFLPSRGFSRLVLITRCDKTKGFVDRFSAYSCTMLFKFV